MQDGMEKVDRCAAIGVKEWKHELERLRDRIGRQRDDLVERMRAGETILLEALYSVAESNPGKLGATAQAGGPMPERSTLEPVAVPPPNPPRG